MMTVKRPLAVLVIALLVLLASAGSVAALTSADFWLVKNSLEGGGSGGGVMSSSDFVLHASFNGTAGHGFSGGGYQACYGYLCVLQTRTLMPAVQRAASIGW